MEPDTSKPTKLNTQVIHFPPVKRETFSGSGKWENWIQPSKATYSGRSIKHYSEGHAASPNGKRYGGGPFYVTHARPHINAMPANMSVNAAGSKLKYSGPIVMPVDLSQHEVDIASDDQATQDRWGADAIAAVDPTNPNADVGVALGEIVNERGITLPGIQAWRQRTDALRAVASEFLAYQFGWGPLVKEVKDTAQSIRMGNTIIENYSANAGTLVHREFGFPSIITEEETQVGTGRCQYSSSGSVSAFHTGNVPIIRKTRTVTDRWFSGSFTYHYGDSTAIGKCLGINSEIDKLFGLTLTPDVMWELAPWSWAIDWFSNAGSVISNATSMGLAGLVIKYGYIMTETVKTISYSMPSTGLICGGTPPAASIDLIAKQRGEANPFGFGVAWDGLNPTQLAITAALGITRLRR